MCSTSDALAAPVPQKYWPPPHVRRTIFVVFGAETDDAADSVLATVPCLGDAELFLRDCPRALSLFKTGTKIVSVSALGSTEVTRRSRQWQRAALHEFLTKWAWILAKYRTAGPHDVGEFRAELEHASSCLRHNAPPLLPSPAVMDVLIRAGVMRRPRSRVLTEPVL